MIRFRVLATAALTVATLASTAAGAAAADGSADEKSPLDAAVSAYQRVYPRISPEMAQLAARQQDARKAVYESLEGGGFGGAWFDPPTGVLHIAAADDDIARRAEEAGKAEGVAVETHLVKRSFDELFKLSEEVRGSEIGKAADGNVGIEVEENTVVAAVPAEQLDKLTAPEGVKLVADPGVETEEDLACTSRFNCDTTLRSGTAIWRGARGYNVCSAGFTARDYYYRYMYTAGHCSGGYGQIWGTGSQAIGPLVQSVNAGFLDASVIRVTNGLYSQFRGGELYLDWMPNRSANVNGVAPTLGFIWRGDFTCLSANFTQPNGPNFCGVIGSTFDPLVRGMVRVNGLDACPGDSGGGWYWLTPSGRRIAYGIHSRSDWGCHGSAGGSRSWFSALPLIKAFMTPSLNVEVRP